MNKKTTLRFAVLAQFVAAFGGMGGTGVRAGDHDPISPRSAGVSLTAPHPAFLRLDTNHDGVIDRREANRLPGLSVLFDEADLDRDGTLDAAEFNRVIGVPLTAKR